MGQPYSRVFNFSAGPATLPVAVLEKCRDGILNWNGSGMGVMEMSHRSAEFEGILAAAEADLRELLSIPDGYKVLFMQGGASLQFSMLADSFLGGGFGLYVVTGAWGQKAVESGKISGDARVLYDGKETNFKSAPNLEELSIDPAASFVHFTSNETIHGVEFLSDPQIAPPLICDMSSDICSRPVDVSRYSLIYAGAQKNMGPAGLTVVIVKDELLEKVPKGLPPMFDYKLQAKNGSMYNTPPCWSIYVTGLVARHLLDNGGIAGAERLREQRSKILYEAIDNSGGFYKGHAEPGSRSRMNVVFTLPTEELNKPFTEGAKAAGLDGLPGHRSVGGFRASIYNAFPVEGCERLAEYMAEFQKKNG